MKRFLSLMLCVVMCISVFTATAGQVYAVADAKTIFKVISSDFKNDEITYTVQLAPDLTKVTGAVVWVSYDPLVLEVVEAHASGSYDADGNFVESIAGVYETGPVLSETGAYAIAYLNANGYTIGSEYKDFFTVKLRAIDNQRRTTGVEFNCIEFATDDGNDDNEIKKSDGLQFICHHSFLPLSMPEVKEANSVNDGIKVVWSDVIGADYYTVYRKTADETAWSTVCSNTGAVSEYTDTDIVKGTEYFYTVSASNGYGSTKYDETGVAGMNFGSIGSIGATAAENGIKITWGSLAGAESYEIFRKTATSSNWQLVNSVKTNEYTDTSVLSGVTYNYRVRAIKGKYSAGLSCEPASAKYIAVPEATVTNTFSGIDISFEEVGGAEKYVIEKKVAGGEYSVIAEIYAGEDTYYLDEAVEGERAYTYRIQALASDMASVKKETATITRISDVDIKTVENKANGVHLTWGGVNGATSYSVYRKVSSEFVWVKCAIVTSTEYTDLTAESGVDYTYSVYAENETGLGGGENVSITFIASPEIASVSSVKDGIRVEWNQVGGAEGYKVYRKASGESAWSVVANTTDNYFVDTAFVDGTRYKYTVSAIKGESESVYDGNGVEGMYFGMITSVSAEAIKDGAKISWSSLDKADGYFIYRKSATETKWTKIAETSSVNYTDKTIESGVTYEYSVKAYNGDSIADMICEPAGVKYLAVPEFTAKNTANGINITVTPVKGAESYVIEKEVNGKFSVIATLVSGKTSYVDTDVEGDVAYKYRVYASSSDVKSFVSDVCEAVRLGHPKITTVKNILPGVYIEWEPHDGAMEYEIYRKDSFSTEWEYFDSVGETSFTDGSVISGEKYSYTVQAVFSDGSCSGYDNSGKSIVFVETPDVVSISNLNGGVYFKWSVVEGADGYYIYRKVGNGEWEKLVEIEGGSKYAYTDASAKAGYNYTYTVAAYKGTDVSSYDSDGLYIKRLTTPQLLGVSNSNGGIYLKWNSVYGASGYQVYRKVGNGGWVKIATLSGNSKVSYSDSNIKAGYNYKYTVRAYFGNVLSYYNTTGLAIKRLTTPKLVSVSNLNNGIYLKWNSVYGASGYQIYRKTGNGGWVKIATISGGSKVAYTDSTAKSGYNYKYTVRAYFGSSLSYYNTTGLAIKRLIAPKLTGVTSAKAGVTVKWNKTYGATGYQVYRKTGNSGWVKIATVSGGSKVSYLDKTAKKGVTYTYTVRAYYGSSLSYYNTTGLKITDRY